METQNYTCCKHNYTLFFFLHRLSIEKAGVYSKEQDKKKKKKKGITLQMLTFVSLII